VKLILPLSVTLPRKKGDKHWILNLNSYRNTHYHVLNQAKQRYKELVICALTLFQEDNPGYVMPKPPFIFTYTVFPATARKFDLANVLPIVQKFTDDALIELGVIKDDCYKIILAVNYRFGRVDKDNPRVELSINEYR